MSTLPKKQNTPATDLSNAISVREVAKKHKITGSFRVMMDLLEKDPLIPPYLSLYEELKRIVSASDLIGGISVRKMAKNHKITGSFQVMKDLLKKTPLVFRPISLYEELDKKR